MISSILSRSTHRSPGIPLSAGTASSAYGAASAGTASYRQQGVVLPWILPLWTVALLGLILPPLSVELPPLLDYPAHLARIQVLWALLHGVSFAKTYRLDPVIVPNLAIDGVVLGLMHLGLGVETAGRILLVITAILSGTGAAVLHAATFRRLSPWPIIGAGFIYCGYFLYGFVNFFFGVGLLLWGAACWRFLSPNRLAAALAALTIFAGLTFCAHLLTWLILAGVIVASEFSLLLASRTTKAVRRLILASAAALWPMLLLVKAPLLTGNAAPGWADITAQLTAGALRGRLVGVEQALQGYETWLDRSSLVLVALVGVAAFALGRLRVDGRMLLPIAGLTLIYLVVPDGWFGTTYLPQRLPVVLLLLGLSATDIEFVHRRGQSGLAALLGLLLLVRGGVVETAWISAQSQMRPLLEALLALPGDARVYSIVAYQGDFGPMIRPPLRTLPAYALIRRGILTSEVFAIPTQNLVVPQPGAVPTPPPPLHVDLHGAPATATPFPPEMRSYYTYALVLNPGLWPGPLPDGTQIVAEAPGYALYHLPRPF